MSTARPTPATPRARARMATRTSGQTGSPSRAQAARSVATAAARRSVRRPPSDLPVRFSLRLSSHSATVDGLIDEIRVFHGVLQPHSILQDYEHSWCSSDVPADYILDGLLAFYDFNEGEGTRVSDAAMAACASGSCSIDLAAVEHQGEVAF